MTGAKPLTRALPDPPKRPEDRAERRQVTVMFSDLVGSTALSARMDPEDLREVISALSEGRYRDRAALWGTWRSHGRRGTPFGYPQAHEDDAERAVRAGLDLIEAVSGLKESPHCKPV